MNSYRIFLNGELIYYSDFEDDKYTIYSPILTMELNKSGSFEFTLPKSNLGYQMDTVPLKTLVRIEKNDYEFWRGRIISVEKDFYLNKKIVCEGELGFLNDYSTVTESTDYSNKPISIDDLMWNLISSARSPYNYDRAIVYERVKEGSDVANYTFNGTLSFDRSIFDTITDIISQYPLFFKIGPDRRDYMRLPGEPFEYPNGVSIIRLYSLNDKDFKSSQTIEFGKNLLDLNEFIDANSIVNSVEVFGKKKSNGERYFITRGVPYKYPDTGFETNSTGVIDYKPSVDIYGYIHKTLIFDNITKSTDLETKGIEYLKKSISLTNSIEISAIDLSILNVDVDEFEIGQFVTIISDPHGLDTNTICSKIVIDFENPENNRYTFGLLYKSLSEQQASSDKTSKDAYTAAMSSIWQEKTT